MPSSCQNIQEQIAGYVDQEFDQAQATTISRHLHGCPNCAEEANLQRRVKTKVQQLAKPIAAPAHLRAGIRRSLAREQSMHWGFLSQLRQLFQAQPLPAFASLVALVISSGLLTYYGLRTPADLKTASAAFVEGAIEGEFICVDCDFLDRTGTAYNHDATHRIGLRSANGEVWSILQSEKGRELMQDLGRFHQHFRVRGRLFKNDHYVEVQEFFLI